MSTRRKGTAAERAEELQRELDNMFATAERPMDLLDQESESEDEEDYLPLTEEERMFLKLEYEEEKRGFIILFFVILIYLLMYFLTFSFFFSFFFFLSFKNMF